MNWIQNIVQLVDGRRLQLQKQADVDATLRRLNATCPATVAAFLLDERQQHRQVFDAMSDTSILDKLNTSMQQMQLWDQRYERVQKLLESSNACVLLYLLTSQSSK